MKKILKTKNVVVFIILCVILVIFFITGKYEKKKQWYLYQEGVASYYGKGFFFKKTASGEIFYPWSISAASRTLPLGIDALVVNKGNGKKLIVRINDRGPYVHGRILDLSRKSAEKLGMIRQGLAKVDIYTKKNYH